MYSHKDDTGRLMVDCTECKHGCNGTQKCNWNITTPEIYGCYNGLLLDRMKQEGDNNGKEARR